MNVIRKVDVALPENLLDLVDRKVASGDFATRSEVIAEGLRTLEAWDTEVEHWLRTEVAQTYDRLVSGEEKTIPLEEVMARWNSRDA